MAKEKAPYVPVEQKIAGHETRKAELTAQLNSAPEDQKAGLQEQINEQDRKIRWYQGRQKSAKFQAKSAPVTPTAEASSDPSPANVATQN